MQLCSRKAFFADLAIGSDEPERGGLLVGEAELIELPNIHPEPANGYMPDTALVLPWIERATGTWHTHPGRTATPSAQDVQSFAGWPDWVHVIVGTDGVRQFRTKNGMAVECRG